MDASLIEIDKNVELTERDRCHLMLHGILSEQKRFVQNQNIKIKRSPVCDESESDDSEPLSENLKE
jgi:hypothetical protein